VEWEDLFLDCLLQSMASNDFDHCPLLFELKDNLSGTWRFHFEAFWLKLEGFQDAVSLGWKCRLLHALLLLLMQRSSQSQKDYKAGVTRMLGIGPENTPSVGNC
jgi:hypothetical protein